MNKEMSYYSKKELKEKSYDELVSIVQDMEMDIDIDDYSEEDSKDLAKKIYEKQEDAVMEQLLELSTKKLKALMVKAGFDKDEVDDIEDTKKNRKNMAKYIFKAKIKEAESKKQTKKTTKKSVSKSRSPAKKTAKKGTSRSRSRSPAKKTAKKSVSKSPSRSRSRSRSPAKKTTKKSVSKSPSRSRSRSRSRSPSPRKSRSRSRSRSRSPSSPSKSEYMNMSLKALKDLAKDLGITGVTRYSASQKEDIVDKIIKHGGKPSVSEAKSVPTKRTSPVRRSIPVPSASPRRPDSTGKRAEYEAMSMTKLKEIAKDAGVPSVYKYKLADKDSLIDEIMSYLHSEEGMEDMENIFQFLFIKSLKIQTQ